MTFDYRVRQQQLTALDAADAAVIVPGANMVYFTGLHFHLSERPTLAIFDKDGNLTFIIPELEVSKLKARGSSEANIIGWSDSEGYQGAFVQAVQDLGLQGATLGVDGQTMRVFEGQAFEHAGVKQLVNIGQDLLNIRAIKTPPEIESMRQAVQLSEQALERLIAWVLPGMSEIEIARELGRLLVEVGAKAESFAPLVQTGPNSALPHGFITERKLEQDDFMLIDFGAMVDGYPADITRTFCPGMPSDEMKKIYDTVLAANRAAVEKVAPGVTCGDIDKAARDVIDAAGYGEYFVHRTGHGLGLEVHELPQIAAGVDVPLQPGMVFTIEPGIYIPELGGVRIEDNVAVTDDGCDVLTTFPRSLSR